MIEHQNEQTDKQRLPLYKQICKTMFAFMKLIINNNNL